MNGQGLFMWQVKSCFDGNIARIIEFCKDLQITRLEVKHYDRHSFRDRLRNPELPELSAACLENDIQLWVWEFNRICVEGPEWNAAISAELARSVNAFGHISNFEDDNGRGWGGAGGKGGYAERYFTQLKKDFPGPLAACSYRTPIQWPSMPWKEALEACAYNMPQLYYEQQQNPAYQIDRAMAQFKNFPPSQFIPVWPAYQWNGWMPSIASVKEALAITAFHKLPAASFWYFEWLHTHPAYIDALRSHPWYDGGVVPTPEPPPTGGDVNIPVKVLSNPYLNIRQEPSATSAIIGTMSYGTTTTVIDLQRDAKRNLWGKLADGRWIAQRYSGSNLTDLCS